MLWAARVKLSLEVLDRTVDSFTLGIVYAVAVSVGDELVILPRRT
jgi:hypothetical protein